MPTTRVPSRKRKVVQRYRQDPVWFGQRVLGTHLWSKQRSVLTSVRDHRRTAVKACHGPGKTYTAAVAVLWFLRLPGARVVTTAPTWTQVKALLWHEIHQLHGRSRYPLGGQLNKTELTMPDGRYAIGLSTKPEQAESFQGHHAPNILIVVDEASGVAQTIFEAGEGYMTTPGARMLLIGNPTRPSGEFYDAFHSKRTLYNAMTISAFDLPAMTGEEVPDDVAMHLTSREWVEEHQLMWREDSPLYQVKVLGQFPSQADDAVISLADVEAAQHRDLEDEGTIAPDAEEVLGVDVARFGTDETVITYRRGLRARIEKVLSGKATTETTGYVKEIAREKCKGKPRVVVDDPGVGGGVTDQLREAGFSVTAFNGGHAALEPDKYPNARSELWFIGGERMAELDLDGDEQLAADLVAPIYKLDSQGRRVVEPKEKTKKRLGRSPDRGDSLLLTLAPERGPTMEVW